MDQSRQPTTDTIQCRRCAPLTDDTFTLRALDSRDKGDSFTIKTLSRRSASAARVLVENKREMISAPVEPYAIPSTNAHEFGSNVKAFIVG